MKKPFLYNGFNFKPNEEHLSINEFVKESDFEDSDDYVNTLNQVNVALLKHFEDNEFYFFSKDSENRKKKKLYIISPEDIVIEVKRRKYNGVHQTSEIKMISFNDELDGLKEELEDIIKKTIS